VTAPHPRPAPVPAPAAPASQPPPPASEQRDQPPQEAPQQGDEQSQRPAESQEAAEESPAGGEGEEDAHLDEPLPFYSDLLSAIARSPEVSERFLLSCAGVDFQSLTDLPDEPRREILQTQLDTIDRQDIIRKRDQRRQRQRQQTQAPPPQQVEEPPEASEGRPPTHTQPSGPRPAVAFGSNSPQSSQRLSLTHQQPLLPMQLSPAAAVGGSPLAAGRVRGEPRHCEARADRRAPVRSGRPQAPQPVAPARPRRVREVTGSEGFLRSTVSSRLKEVHRG